MNKRENIDEKTKSTSAQPSLQEILASTGSKRRKSRKYTYLFGAAIIIAAAGGYYYFTASSGSTYTYTTTAAKKDDLSVIVTSTGSVQPTDQVDISSELSGTVRKVNVTYNSEVKAGDVLLELDTNKLEADVQSARAKLASAKASVVKARAELGSAETSLNRLKSLVQNRVSTQQDLDAAQYNYNSAAATLEVNEASVLSSEADLRLAELNLGKGKIVAPINGVILTRDVDPGATVASSLNAPVLFTMAGDLREMELQVAVDEADVGKVQNGQQATFSVDAYPEESFPAEIQTVRYASETVANVVTYKAILTVDNSNLKLRPGMTATANIVVESIKDALLIPNAALRYSPPQQHASSGGGLMGLFRPPRMGRGGNRGGDSAGRAAGQRTVWILKNGTPVSERVETGSTDGQFTVVKSGNIQPDDALITDAIARRN